MKRTVIRMIIIGETADMYINGHLVPNTGKVKWTMESHGNTMRLVIDTAIDGDLPL